MAFTDANWQQSVSDAHLKQRIHEGLTEVGMPSFVKGVTPPLNDDQVESLVKYVREIGIQLQGTTK